MTLAGAILSAKAGRAVWPGDTVDAAVDLLMGHDGTFPLGIAEIEREGLAAFDPARMLLVCDHFAPPATVERAAIQKLQIDYAKRCGIPLALGSGICHQLLLEHPLALPGRVILGADSHTVTAGALGALATGLGTTDFVEAMTTGRLWLRVPAAVKIVLSGRLAPHVMGKDIALEVLRRFGSDGCIYKSLEFFDNTEDGLAMDHRAAVANMSVETGAKCGIWSPDAILRDYLARRGQPGPYPAPAVAEADYEQATSIDCATLPSLVAAPHDPGNVHPVDRFAGTPVQQVFLGSCTAGRLEDLRVAAAILRGRTIAPHLKMIVIPGSTAVFLEAIRQGYIQDLLAAGAMVSNPSCGPCCNIDKGLLAPGEVCLSTSNRNFPGRMGALDSEVYLASPATAAATALRGVITDPARYL
jgi:3-isopropylmalate dehydratase large subunit